MKADPDGRMVLRTDVPYWTRGEPLVNFGDALTFYLMRRALVGDARIAADVYRIVGSVVSDWTVETDLDDPEGGGRHVFWGCGLREAAPLLPGNRTRCRFPAVRGPYTRDVLDLPRDVPMGDPGLLLPIITRGTPDPLGGGTLLVPHILDPRDRDGMLEETGCDRLLEPSIEPTPEAVEAFVGSIAAASFVLTSSLHGAVTACAYGVPYAYWSAGGLIDAPFKWHDFAASVRMPAVFASDLAQAQEAVGSDRSRPRLPRLRALLDSAPFTPSAEILARADAFDRDPSSARRTVPLPDSDRHLVREATAVPDDVAPAEGRPPGDGFLSRLRSRILPQAGR